MQRFIIPAALAAVGCTGEITEQLEAITVSGLEDNLSGTFAATGQDRDYVLTDEQQSVVVDIHTPTAAVLTALDGRVLSFESEGGAPTRTWRASDPDPAWLVYRNGSTALVDEWFGAEFATLGEKVGHERPSDGGIARRDFHTAQFQTDDGPVELLPGDVDTLTIAGVSWRVGVVAAWFDNAAHTNSKCGAGDQAMLSYELLRVDAPVEPDRMTRSPELELPQTPRGCGG